ncbi:MAG TPA: slipin family protein [Bacillota bacterium]|jgi:regulator of protease activity HflC (stomatin/prohibitin superfamily)|nr:slipin family protein [Peptococcaceae bacterium]HPU36149.1 slipin family protein [Bacillota bacterium]HPZ43713.1 slipin family protein [Bacillota bacterium]HUM58539.1 slipin family protein [Bacillota bacterium]
MQLYDFFTTFIVVILLVIILASAIKIIPEYERAVLFRLGRLMNARGPGLIFIIPVIDRIIRVSLRVIVFDIPPQEVITRDNVTCKINAVLFYRVVEAEKAVVNVENFHEATNQLAQTTLRSVAGMAELDEILSQREKLNVKIQRIVDEATDPWGIKIVAVEIKDVVLPSEMTRAIARQAEAERNRRAAIIQAEGERQAAEQLAQASEILTGTKGGLTLRMLRSLSEVSNSSNTTVLFPLPMELRDLLPGKDKTSGSEEKTSGSEE